MCGIAGELRFNGQPTKADWGLMSSLMKRRGPDDKGFWTDDNCCTLVFRRLSILDLDKRANQPMTACNNRYALVFNGELYNFLSIKKKLLNKGIKFRTTGDSEVVLHSLIEYGYRAFEEFNGMFALAFYDSEKRHLLLARDHAGIKPLYFMRTDKGFFFSSQYDQILTHPWSKELSISKEALAIYLRLAFIPAPYAILQNTSMLEPGTWVEVSADGNFQKGIYFSFPKYVVPELKGDDAIEAVDSAITKSVQRQLISDVPVGAFLSGGIDSPLVVSKMASLNQSSVEAFTIGTNSRESDESLDAAIYADEIGVKHNLQITSEEQALSMLDDIMEACSEPFGDYSIFPTTLVCQLASKRFKVMLSGDGGDELFWGYPDRMSPKIKSSNIFLQPVWFRQLRYYFKRRFGIGMIANPHFKGSLGLWHRNSHTHLNLKWLITISNLLPEWPESFETFNYNGWKKEETAQWLRWNEFVCHLTMVLLKVDRSSMYNSLEVRVPLLDLEVINIASKVDWQSCIDIDSKIGKLPLRKILSRHVNHQTIPKKGFSVPMGDWLRTSLRGFFEEYVLNRKGILDMEINQDEMRKLFQLHLSGHADLSWGLWPLLSLSLWEKKYYN